MEKITKPCPVDERRYVFTENMNYFNTGKKSIWGQGDKETLNLLDKEQIKGNWLHLAAGDGRYNLILLKKADSVTVTDIDASALSKLWYYTPEEYKSNLKIKVFNLLDKFPFKDDSLDGIFNTGTLHLFPQEVAEHIFKEIHRVLKPGGKVIIDFAVDAKRTKINDGMPYIIKNRKDYTIDEAKIFLKRMFNDYEFKITESEPMRIVMKKANPPYILECRFLLLVAKKNN
ncbi:MAG: class I SAM-dependent methyltransferase [archaeon]